MKYQLEERRPPRLRLVPAESTTPAEKKVKESTPFRFMDLPFVPMKFLATKFDIRDIITVSLTSFQFAELMKSMKIKSPRFIVTINENIILDTGIPNLPKYVFKLDEPMNLSKCTLETSDENEKMSWNLPDFGVTEWINYLMRLFYCNEIEIKNYTDFGLVTIQNLSAGLDAGWIHIHDERDEEEELRPNSNPTTCSTSSNYYPISSYHANSRNSVTERVNRHWI